VNPETHEALKAMAQQRGTTMQDLIQELVEDARANMLLDQMNAGYAVMKVDESAWADELAERAEWDAVLGDGLE
jgi:ribosome assembly protein YihI (activator of Der GTPase)